MTFSLPALPYDRNALAPHISSNTLDYHYGKHHQKYVDTLNDLIKGTANENADLETIIKNSDGGIFNNAAQVWNHTFYWNSLSPNGGGAPTGDLAAAIDRDFGSLNDFKAQFKAAAMGQFGSGWAWLVKDSAGKLGIVKTLNAETPLTTDKTALITCDVWEHAYYLDYQNARPNYVDTFLDKLINWEFAAKNFAA